MNERLTSGEWTVPATGNLAIANDAQFSDKVRGFPAFLESRGVRLIGAYGSVGFSGLRPEDPPGVTIIETDNDGDLGAIPNYYTPYLTYSLRTPSTAITPYRVRRRRPLLRSVTSTSRNPPRGG